MVGLVATQAWLEHPRGQLRQLAPPPPQRLPKVPARHNPWLSQQPEQVAALQERRVPGGIGPTEGGDREPGLVKGVGVTDKTHSKEAHPEGGLGPPQTVPVAIVMPVV